MLDPQIERCTDVIYQDFQVAHLDKLQSIVTRCVHYAL
jgi:hypothetical protein